MGSNCPHLSQCPFIVNGRKFLIVLSLIGIGALLTWLGVKYFRSYVLTAPLTTFLVGEPSELTLMMQDLHRAGIVIEPSEYVGHLINVLAVYVVISSIVFTLIVYFNHKSVQFDMKEELRKNVEDFLSDPKIVKEIYEKNKGRLQEELVGIEEFQLLRDNVRALEKKIEEKKIDSFMQRLDSNAQSDSDFHSIENKIIKPLGEKNGTPR